VIENPKIPENTHQKLLINALFSYKKKLEKVNPVCNTVASSTQNLSSSNTLLFLNYYLITWFIFLFKLDLVSIFLDGLQSFFNFSSTVLHPFLKLSSTFYFFSSSTLFSYLFTLIVIGNHLH